MLVIIAAFLKLIIGSGKMQKLNLILIFLLTTLFFHSYADCPTVETIQKSKGYTVENDDGSKWSSNIDLQIAKIGTVFNKVVVTAVKIEDEDGKPTTLQSLADINCEYKIKAVSETKCSSSYDKTCTFTLKPQGVLKLYQCTIKKPTNDPQSPWVLEAGLPSGYYKNLVSYSCIPKNNLVGGCPFSFDTHL
ncbi:MAG: hypothetical protein K0R14_1481 [Burkholderiales bacterium]|jgi:hypothetical protein|nr:hypothetical protein [Burkholderiales bacterium]